MDYTQLEGGPGKADNVEEGKDTANMEMEMGTSPPYDNFQKTLAANRAAYNNSTKKSNKA